MSDIDEFMEYYKGKVYDPEAFPKQFSFQMKMFKYYKEQEGTAVVIVDPENDPTKL